MNFHKKILPKSNNDGVLVKKTDRLYAFLLVLTLLLTIAGCSGGDAPAPDSTTTTTTITTTPSTEDLTMSAITFGVNPLSAYGTTGISVTILSSGIAYTNPVAIDFSATCAGTGKATLTSSVTTINGVASASYVDNGCAGSDIILASITGGPSTSSVLEVNAPDSGSLQFVSATPDSIALKGSGGADRQETSRVIFKLLDTAGNPIGGKTVNFSLSTNVGGLSLSSFSSISDPTTGWVVVDVMSGTVSSAVRVIATTTTDSGTILSTQSDQLVISTGLPDQDSFSISASIHNPGGWDFDGEQSTFTIRVSDHFNNPVPDGTVVYFTTEGGQIEPSCTTVAGACGVNWTSQDPRPQASASDRAGLATILVTAIGEESFNDVNGDGKFDTNDFANFTATPGLDLPEAWRDDNLNGAYDSGELFTDFNSSGTYTAANGMYDGTLCTSAGEAAGVCTKDLVNVRTSFVISMSGSTNFNVQYSDTSGVPISVICLRDDDGPGGTYADDINPVDGCPDTPANLPADQGAGCDDVAKFFVKVSDMNGNSPPNGTTIDATSSLGSMLGTSSYTVAPNTIEPFVGLFSIQEVCGGVPQAEIEIKITPPNGNSTTTFITVLDDG